MNRFIIKEDITVLEDDDLKREGAFAVISRDVTVGKSNKPFLYKVTRLTLIGNPVTIPSTESSPP